MPPEPVLVWFRNDLRIADNPALAEAGRIGAPVIPVFIQPRNGPAAWAPGNASRGWLRQSLAALGESLNRAGSRLILRRGSVERELAALARETRASALYFSRRWEPAERALQGRIEGAMRALGLETRLFEAGLLFDPESVRTKTGGPYRVFTAYYRAVAPGLETAEAARAPARFAAPQAWPDSLPLDRMGLDSAWPSAAARAPWSPGEAGALARFGEYLRGGALASYEEARDLPAQDGTSRLSPHLAFGEIGPRQIVQAIRRRIQTDHSPAARASARAFLRQIVWREFAYHLLAHLPHTPEEPLRAEFAAFPWSANEERLEAWRQGRTGYPIVDAGMRQLLETGWMHNRARMIAASFLVKDLAQPWQAGARWFWERLIDADLANNTLGWQWCAGCGADAQPFFRIFNPALQAEKFDAEGKYIRAWVEELQNPLEGGREYPAPIVDHAVAARQALAAYRALKRR